MLTRSLEPSSEAQKEEEETTRNRERKSAGESEQPTEAQRRGRDGGMESGREGRKERGRAGEEGMMAGQRGTEGTRQGRRAGREGGRQECLGSIHVPTSGVWSEKTAEQPAKISSIRVCCSFRESLRDAFAETSAKSYQ